MGNQVNSHQDSWITIHLQQQQNPLFRGWRLSKVNPVSFLIISSSFPLTRLEQWESINFALFITCYEDVVFLGGICIDCLQKAGVFFLLFLQLIGSEMPPQPKNVATREIKLKECAPGHVPIHVPMVIQTLLVCALQCSSQWHSNGSTVNVVVPLSIRSPLSGHPSQ